MRAECIAFTTRTRTGSRGREKQMSDVRVCVCVCLLEKKGKKETRGEEKSPGRPLPFLSVHVAGAAPRAYQIDTACNTLCYNCSILYNPTCNKNYTLVVPSRLVPMRGVFFWVPPFSFHACFFVFLSFPTRGVLVNARGKRVHEPRSVIELRDKNPVVYEHLNIVHTHTLESGKDA